MRKQLLLEILRRHGVSDEVVDDVLDDLNELGSECLAAAAEEEAAHGFDFDEDAGRCVNPNTGESVWDLEPHTVTYNDAGEPRGYM